MVDMIETDPASDEAWSRGWRERVHAWYATLGTPAAAEAFCRGWTTAQPRLLGLLVEEGERIGHVAACVPAARDGGDPVGTVIDIWVEPRHRGRGHGRLARDYAKAWAA
jgi:GNAT superfamily N-acetyltransferase